MTEEKVQPNEEQKRRVFQCLDMSGAGQLTVLQQKGSELHGTEALTVVLEKNKANQFVLENNREPYLQILRNLRRALKNVRHVEMGIGADGKRIIEGELPKELIPKKPGEELKEAKLKAAETSEVITNLKAVAQKQNEDMESMQETIAELKAQLSKGGK